MQPLLADISEETVNAQMNCDGNLDILSVSCKKGSFPILTVNNQKGSAEHVQV
jgi:DNA gyrase/topoisomerase IV subunit A